VASLASRTDPIAALSHDHSELGALVVAVSSALREVSRGERPLADVLHELDDGAESLRDGLMEHFAREEEGLFPFIERHLPDMRPQVEQLRLAHEAVCGVSEELVRAVAAAATRSGDAERCIATFERFEERYGEHAREELSFLRAVDARLEPAAREELRALLDAI